MRNHRLKDLNATSEDWSKAVELGKKSEDLESEEAIKLLKEHCE